MDTQEMTKNEGEEGYDFENSSYPIIDSHIHLYPSSEFDNIGWLQSSSPLYRQYSLDEYVTATSAESSTPGFIFIEVNRKHDLSNPGSEDNKGWEMPLKEVDFARRIALGTPRNGEGHSAEQRQLCRGIIPWAPIPCGEEVLELYLAQVKVHAGESFPKIRGFRYLVHDKPRGVMLEENFIKGLRWLGRRNFTFDLGVDQHRRGKWQLEEAIQMISNAHDGVNPEDKVHVIIDHLCKPNLSIYNQTDPIFIAWRASIFSLSKCSCTYMKLSGCFSEMPATLKAASVDKIFIAMQPYLAVILATFGPSRIMFGSDWPVCTPDINDAWNKWRLVVQRFCSLASLSPEEQKMIWSGTAIKAYGLDKYESG
ncbi:L-rhamnono-gamma-lactonase [Golovinomyces cichoracearum]|uniref:L-rhamnono-gamma-lactonase n=1 Tax=Golovinomyces cichoracearum TaxID=62708 RepID=A0A420ILE2_9PEZI|nr:L-rhamnono-gamma-lactonase [Golovinomyces cichoracearum]